VPVDLFRNYHHSTPRTERLDILSCVLAWDWLTYTTISAFLWDDM
jgi:hypothetical protein